jgi:hypothetical protein
MSAAKQKPELTVMQTPTVDDIMALGEQISGTKATPEQRQEVVEILAQAEAKAKAKLQ